MDYFSFVKKRGAVADEYIKYVILSYNSYGPVKQTLFFLLGCLFKNKFYCRKKYIFTSAKYNEIINCFPSKDILIIGGLRDYFFCLKHKLDFLPAPYNAKKMLALELEEKTTFKDKFINIDNIKRNLKSSELPILFIPTDSLPYERFFINNLGHLLSKKIVIQHGIVQSIQMTKLEDGLYSDFVLCYNQFQKEIYEKYLPKKSSVKCIDFGFYKNIKSSEIISNSTYDVCIVGQPFEKTNKIYGKEYVTLLNEFYLKAQKENLSVCYKPHPGESDLSYISTLFEILNVSYEDSFIQADAYVSFTSTYLYEANLRGCKVFQIKMYSTPQDVYFPIIDFNENVSLKNIFTCIHNAEKILPLSKRLEEFMTEYKLI